MTMTAVDVQFPEPMLPRSMSVDQWAALDVERNVELVAGVPVVSPFEPVEHVMAAHRLGRLIETACPGVTAIVGLPVDCTVEQVQPVVRIPDLVVCRAEPRGDSRAVPASQAVLVVEVVSATSVERGWVSKRVEYAAAGIGHYLIVDRFTRQVVLFGDPEDARYTSMVDGSAVTLTLGEALVEVGLTDLFD